MLTREMLAANAALTGLTEEQIVAITQMSQNDENAVIGAKIGALHGQYDTDIFSITGIAKNGVEKSYDYAKRVLTEYKNKFESTKGLQSELDKAKAEVTKLTKQIENGEGNEALKQQLKDSKNLVTQLQSSLTEKTKELDTVKADYESKIKNTHVDYAFSQAFSGLKFKAGITDKVKDILLQSAKNEVLAKGTPDFIDENGSKKLVFRDQNGIVLANASNNLNPYTVQEMLMETSIKDVLDTSTKQQGGGTIPPGGGGGGNRNTIIDLSSAKTQVEADRLIEQHLLSNGLTRDSAEFSEQLTSIRNENNVSTLPIR